MDVERKHYSLDEWTVKFTRSKIWQREPNGKKALCRGLTNFETNTITIDATFIAQIQKDSFLHEIIHIIDYFKDVFDKDGEHYKHLDEEEYTLLREYVISESLRQFDWMLKQREKRRR